MSSDTFDRPLKSVSSDPYSTPSEPNSATIKGVSFVLSLFALAAIAGISLCIAKKIRRELTSHIVTNLQTIITPPANNVHVIPVWEVDAPTKEKLEKLLQELAREKPVRFTAQQLCNFTKDYSTILGAGGFEVVYKGQFPNGVAIAVKVLNRTQARSTAEDQFMAEVGTIGRTYHINLVRLYGFCHDQFMSALVYEFVENGSLDKYLFDSKQEIEWEKLHDIAIGTAKGIAYLHEECQQSIIHYDIKPGNILLDANFFPKVADFGLANLCNEDGTHVSVSGYRGTPGYSAPEFIWKNHPITHKCDVYSFGMVLFEIIGRRRNAGTNANSDYSLDWFPKQVWEEHEKNELEALMTVACGIGEKDREKAIRMVMVALWCVQDSPAARPPMSVVVKMLEGGVEIMEPPKPFHYLYSVTIKPPPETSSTAGLVRDSTRSESGSNSYWYKDSTQSTTKYEIRITSS